MKGNMNARARDVAVGSSFAPTATLPPPPSFLPVGERVGPFLGCMLCKKPKDKLQHRLHQEGGGMEENVHTVPTELREQAGKPARAAKEGRRGRVAGQGGKGGVVGWRRTCLFLTSACQARHERTRGKGLRGMARARGGREQRPGWA